MEWTIRTGRLLLVATLAACWFAPAQATSLREVYAATNAAVVTVFTSEAFLLVDEYPRVAKIEHEAAGVIISGDGDLLTASHAVETADKISVKLHDGRVVPARVIASEPEADVALLRLEEVPASAGVAHLGDSDDMQVGDDIFITGAPHGVEHFLSVGRLSARSRPDQVGANLTLGEFFATDAHISQGTSGAPMFNFDGEVIGIVTHLMGEQTAGARVGFGATSNAARRLLIERQSFWGGFRGTWLEELLAPALNVPQKRGLLVQRVASDSPAAQLGLRAGTLASIVGGVPMILGGDIILSIQGVPLDEEGGYEKARGLLSRLKRGEPLTMKVMREGEILELKTPLPARD